MTDTSSSLDDPLPMDSGESSLSTVLSPREETLLFATICPLLLLVLLHCSKCQIKLGIYSDWRKKKKKNKFWVQEDSRPF
jgi:hypothetical protein